MARLPGKTGPPITEAGRRQTVINATMPGKQNGAANLGVGGCVRARVARAQMRPVCYGYKPETHGISPESLADPHPGSRSIGMGSISTVLLPECSASWKKRI